jgi:hypothetical protein
VDDNFADQITRAAGPQATIPQIAEKKSSTRKVLA